MSWQNCEGGATGWDLVSQSRVVINSAVAEGTQVKERIFGCGII